MLESVSDSFKFQLMIISIVVIFLTTYYFKFNEIVNVVALGCIVGIVLYVQLENYTNEISDRNKHLEYKLNEIQNTLWKYTKDKMKKVNKMMTIDAKKKLMDRVALKWLYTDAKLISYLNSLLFLYKYNEESYVQMVMGVEGILKIRGELEEYYNANGNLPNDVYYFSETADELRTKVLNFAHTFIYKIPKTYDSEVMIERIMKTLHELIKPHVQTIKKMTIKHTIQQGVNKTTRFQNTIDHLAKPLNLDSNRFELYI